MDGLSRFFTIFLIVSFIISGYLFRKLAHYSTQDTRVSIPVEAPSKQNHNNSTSNNNASKKERVFSCNKNFGFVSLNNECDSKQLKIIGSIPYSLQGMLIANGPAQFELNGSSVKYWFHGFAMLHSFIFNKGSVSYKNKFLQSDYYTHCIKDGKLPKSYSSGRKSFFSRLVGIFSKPNTYDNANINTYKIGNEFIATTETTTPVKFNPKTLKAKGIFCFTDEYLGHIRTAHPIYDIENNELFFFEIKFAKNSTYHLYKMNNKTNQRTLITSITTDKPSYMRTFSLTKNYIILSEIPFFVNPFDLLLSAESFIDNFQWKPERGSSFIVINRHNGKEVGRYQTPAFFMFYHINAIEKGDTIQVNIITFDNSAIIPYTRITELKKKTQSDYPASYLEQFSINVKDGTVKKERICEKSIEFPYMPIIHKQKNTNFVYGLSMHQSCFPNSIIKINKTTGLCMQWFENGCYPTAPCFLPHPHAKTDDEGIIFSVVLDCQTEKSFLLLLNAKTFNEIGRALLPHHIPLGLSCQFYS